jgi:hypothetical protein|tara:strand:- start:860 stop:1558 length:699 start_codon:yes stop_codon:yes gene_type:complete
MANFLKIIQNAADEIGIVQPATGINSGAVETIKLIRYADKVGNSLMKSFHWQILTKEKTFTSVATETQTSTILEADFDRFIPETFWDRTDSFLMTGPTTAKEWQNLKATSYNNTGARKFRLRGDSILIIPVPTAGLSYAYEYISTKWVDIAATGTPKVAFTIDTDVPLLNPELLTLGIIYEYLEGDGLPSVSAAKAYLDMFKLLAKNDQPSSGTLVAGDIFSGKPTGGTTIL